MPLPLEITPAEVKRRLDSGELVKLIDVREPQEHAMSNIPCAELIPMRAIPSLLPKLEEDSSQTTLIVFCHHGMRSLQVVSWLREQGVDACQSMSGGIDQWSTEIDPAVPRYY